MKNNGLYLKPWMDRLILGIWIITLVAVEVLTLVHLPTLATIRISCREVSLEVDPTQMFSASNQRQFSVSGPTKLRVFPDANGNIADSITIDVPSTAASCIFYFVRTQSLRSAPDAEVSPESPSISLLWPEHSDADTLMLRFRKNVSGSLYATGSAGQPSFFLCSGIGTASDGSDTLEETLANGTAATFRTFGDAQLVFHEIPEGPLEKTLHVSGRIRVEHVDPLDSGRRTATIIASPLREQNRLTFDAFHKTLALLPTDLIEITSGTDLYVTKIAAKNGIDLEIRGTVKDVRVGAGPENMRSYMPSVFALLVAQRQYLAVVPGVAAFIVWALERIGLLRRRRVHRSPT